MSPRRKSSRADGKSPDALSSSNVKVVASNGMEPQPPQARLLGARGTCPVCVYQMEGTDSAMLEKQNFV